MTVRTCAAIAAVLISAGCGAATTEEKPLPPVNVKAASMEAGFTTVERLAEAAKTEGELNVIALPRDWVNYGEIIDTFADKYDIKVNQLEPTASSQRAIEAAGLLKPDVFDLSLEVAVANAARFAPYKVSGWQDLADHVKDRDGAWYAGYGGYMSLGYDSRKVPVPASFADLLKPGYTVALAGDPRQSAAAFNGVMAASMVNGVPQVQRGVDLFTKLKKAGQLIQQNTANVFVDWDYLNAGRAAQHGEGWKVTIPKDAPLGAYYVQAINKDAPHPAAARLWQEFLFSDEGQNLFLKGYARPARGEAMLMKGTLNAETAAQLPAPPGPPVLLTIPQTDAAKTYINKTWAG
ncbi:ABC transporter substrate-binding protein [Nonomuraea sp. NPDC049152]|uniref:ABC transporter substrate-binding protein n=1 Tax=Nonomuraea sp. NPDC049152 TaxID=3154350 RepID=UPI0033EC2286